MLEQAHPPFARLETPKAHPASKTFTPIFNTVGGATWDAFDTFLAESSGMTFSCLLNDCHKQIAAADAEDAPDAQAKVVTSDRSVPWQLKCDKEGFPILPSSEQRSLPDIKQIIRSFLTLNYRKSGI
jgi:hypothetical protein